MTDQAHATIIGPALPNLPWEDRPEGNQDVVWRSARNRQHTMKALVSRTCGWMRRS